MAFELDVDVPLAVALDVDDVANDLITKQITHIESM